MSLKPTSDSETALETMDLFDMFAPSLLQVHHQDKEAFWTAVLAS